MPLSDPKAGVHTDALRFGCSKGVSDFLCVFTPQSHRNLLGIFFFFLKAHKILYDAFCAPSENAT